MARLYPVIMCGGAGTRLWPLSRQAMPKQFHALVTQNSMLGATMSRSKQARGLDIAPPSFVCALDYEELVRSACAAEGLGSECIILEPCARNTAPVAAVIALEMARRDPEGLVLLLPADHHIEDSAGFWEAVKKAIPAAKSGALTTFGILPTRPETGYGYIRAAEGFSERLEEGVVKVERFVEKPDAKTASEYVASGDYFWNAGMFLFSPAKMVEAFEAHAADILRDSALALAAATRKDGAIYLDAASFAACRKDSIDYAIMEQSQNVAMVCPVNVGWSDIGSWEAIADHSLMQNNPACIGDVIAMDCKGSYLRSEGPMLAVVGLEDVVVVAMDDAVIVLPKSRAQSVKDIVEALKAKGRTALL